MHQVSFAPQGIGTWGLHVGATFSLNVQGPSPDSRLPPSAGQPTQTSGPREWPPCLLEPSGPGLEQSLLQSCDLGPRGRPGGGFSRGHSGQPAGSALPTPRPVQMFVLAGRHEILEQLDPSPKCSVTCQACQPVPGHLAPVNLGHTGCKRVLVGGLPQPLPHRGCQHGRALAVFRSLLSFTSFLTFCYRIHSVAGWWQWGWAL